MNVKLNYECYGCLSVIYDQKILIIGGYNLKKLNQIYTIDIITGEKQIFQESNDIYWSILPMIGLNGYYHFFSTGEEYTSVPQYFMFDLKIE